MAMIFTSPSKYVQGPHVLAEISRYATPLGHKFFVILSASGEKRVGQMIRTSFINADQEVVFAIFNQECCRSEINRLLALYQDSGCDCVIGVGGGKIIDTAKVVAKESSSPIIIAPTIAATDAPCSAAAIIYTEEGVVSGFSSMICNPHLVLVDSAIVVKAGSRLLVSGMGDALATYFEAQAVWDAGKDNVVGGTPTITSLALAKLCYDTLLAEGYKAKCAVSCGCLTPAVEKIIEANTLLSGLGFESGRPGQPPILFIMASVFCQKRTISIMVKKWLFYNCTTGIG